MYRTGYQFLDSTSVHCTVQMYSKELFITPCTATRRGSRTPPHSPAWPRTCSWVITWSSVLTRLRYWTLIGPDCDWIDPSGAGKQDMYWLLASDWSKLVKSDHVTWILASYCSPAAVAVDLGQPSGLVHGQEIIVLASDWSRGITWPGYWPLIGHVGVVGPVEVEEDILETEGGNVWSSKASRNQAKCNEIISIEQMISQKD